MITNVYFVFKIYLLQKILFFFFAALVMTCQDPGNVEHSRKVITGSRFTVGSTVKFICNKGYILSGSSLLTCYNRDSATPKWNERLPKCVRKSYKSETHMLYARACIQLFFKVLYK